MSRIPAGVVFSIALASIATGAQAQGVIASQKLSAALAH